MPESWKTLRDRVRVVGGPCVHPTAEHGAKAGRALPPTYEELMTHFGAGAFGDEVRVQPPQHLSTYGERMRLDELPADDPFTATIAAARDFVIFATTDNGDDFAWRDGDAVFVRHGRGTEFVPHASDCREFVERLLRDMPTPWFAPMRKRYTVSARIPFAACPTKRELDAMTKGSSLLAAADEPKHGWSSRTVYFEADDTVVHLQFVTGGPKVWCTLRAVFADPTAGKRAIAEHFEGEIGVALANAKAFPTGLDL